MKTCTNCNILKSSKEFYRRQAVKDGLTSWCKKCYSSYTKKYRKLNSKTYTQYQKEYHKRYQKENKTRLKQQRQQYYQDNIKYYKTVNKKNRLLREYGISLNKYHNMLQQQDCRCAICNKRNKQLVIDHNHKTGKIKGLLCNKCNSGIGFLQDSVHIINKARIYLQNDKTLV